MQKDIIHNDPLEDDEENRKPKVGITITIPIRNADGGSDEE
ncbi:hypothetical protein ABZ770_26730 [Streptomyces sp. NPDC006654]|jgi:hypothetical protein